MPDRPFGRPSDKKTPFSHLPQPRDGENPYRAVVRISKMLKQHEQQAYLSERIAKLKRLEADMPSQEDDIR